ncbi:MAG: hypothetical protein AVDCRST_MAG53-1372, partial [uncultured Solirubrobacteraceae bacterium]
DRTRPHRPDRRRRAGARRRRLVLAARARSQGRQGPRRADHDRAEPPERGAGARQPGGGRQDGLPRRLRRRLGARQGRARRRRRALARRPARECRRPLARGLPLHRAGHGRRCPGRRAPGRTGRRRRRRREGQARPDRRDRSRRAGRPRSRRRGPRHPGRRFDAAAGCRRRRRGLPDHAVRLRLHGQLLPPPGLPGPPRPLHAGPRRGRDRPRPPADRRRLLAQRKPEGLPEHACLRPRHGLPAAPRRGAHGGLLAGGAVHGDTGGSHRRPRPFDTSRGRHGGRHPV